MSGDQRDRLEQEAEYDATRQQVARFQRWLVPGFVVCQFVPHALSKQLIAVNVVRRRDDHTPLFFDALISRAARQAQMALVILPSLKTETALGSMLSRLRDGENWSVDASKQALPGKARAVDVQWHGGEKPASVMGFFPSGLMPVTRRAPYAAIAVWAAGEQNLFRATASNVLGPGDMPVAWEREKYEAKRVATRDELKRMRDDQHEPMVLQRTSFCLSEAALQSTNLLDATTA